MIAKGRERLTNQRIIAGLLELGCHVGSDGLRADAFHRALTREDAVYGSEEFASQRLDLPQGEEVRELLGLASPCLVDEQAEDELVAALLVLVNASAAFHRIIRRNYYGEESTL